MNWPTKIKMKMLEMRFELNVNEVIEEIAGLRKMDIATGWEIIDMNLDRGTYQHKWGMWWGWQRWGPRGNDTSKEHTWKESLEMLHNLQSTQDRL